MTHDTHRDLSTPIQRLLNDAAAHINAGRLDEAVAVYTETLGLAPDNADVHHTLGLVHYERGRTQEALYHIGRSLELNPSNDVAYRSMADALVASRQFSLAIRAYERAYALNPNNTDALLNLGNLFHVLDMFDLAERTFEIIIAQAQEHLQALNNLGKLNHDMGRLKRALAFYDRCLDRYPRHADAQFNRAALLLAMGDFKRGWEAYEWRFRRSSAANVYPHRFDIPRWQGDIFNNRRLLVHCEQGMGDVLQFMRYLPMVKQRGGTVIVEVHEPLVPLLELLPCVDEVIVFNAKQPPTIPCDLHIPLLSLPKVFDTRADTIPNAIPYIEVDRQSPGTWLRHLHRNRLNIGLVWASSAINPKRNLPIEKCGAWFDHPDLHFIALQKGDATEQIMPLKEHASPVTVVGPDLNNFLDTANIISNLDLVISVDTAAMHLAGGMGRPLWVLLPFNADWRWPLDEKRCAWYPHARLIRQSAPGDWDSVITTVTTMLQRLSPV